MSAKTVRSVAQSGEMPSLASELNGLAHGLRKALFDTYRPELHYMRGPGPKWRAKHDRSRL